MDYAHNQTDNVIKGIERRLRREYKQATKEIEGKILDYMKRFEVKDKTWAKWVADGKKTESEYKAWRKGQMMTKRRWQKLKTQIATDMANVNEIARSIARIGSYEAYALNMNYATYQIEKGLNIDTTFTLYDHDAIERLAREDASILPMPGKKVSKAIRKGEDILWNKRAVQSSMMQSILQGESIPKMARRLAVAVGEKNFKAALRNARTMCTGAENAGRLDSYQRMSNLGVGIKKQWMATLDGRTRHEHRDLDGQAVDINEPFEVGAEKIMYPGDPFGSPAMVYNCRCTMVQQIEGFENDLSDMSIRNDSKIGDMSYDEWKSDRSSYSDPIDKQVKQSAYFRNLYTKEYKNG